MKDKPFFAFEVPDRGLVSWRPYIALRLRGRMPHRFVQRFSGIEEEAFIELQNYIYQPTMIERFRLWLIR
jgi:hypothetical protein